MAWFDVRRSALRADRFETRTRLWSWLKWPAFVLGGLYAFYLVAGNALISFGAVEWLANMQPRQLVLHIGRGWTVFPGRVHFDDFRLRFQDRNVQFFLTVDRGVVDIALFDLPRQFFHSKHLQAEGVRYWMRHKVHDTKGIEKRLAAYPPIPGVPALPLYDIAPPGPPITDEEYDLWTVQFDDVVGTVKDMWFLDGRYQGAGTVVGAFRLKPDRELWVGPATLELEPGAFTLGDYTASPDLSLRTEVVVEPYDVQVPKGLEVFQHVSVDLALRGHLPDTKFLALYLPEDVHVDGARRLLETTLHLQHGRLRQGTTVRLASAETKVRAAAFGFAGPVALAVDVKDPGEGTVETVARVSGEVRIPIGKKDGTVVVTLPGAVGEMRTASASIAKDPEVAVLRGELTRARMSIDDLAPLLPAGFVVRDGTVEVSGQGRYEPQKAMEGTVQARLENVGLEIAGVRGFLRGTVEASVPHQNVEAKAHKGAVRVALDSIGVRTKDATAGDRMLVEGNVEVEARGKEQLVRMPFRVDGPSGRVVAAALGGTPWFVQLGAPLLEGAPLKAKGEMTMQGDRIGLRVADGHVGSLAVRGGLLSRGDELTAAWLLRSGALSVGLAMANGGVGPQFFASDGWLEDKLRRLDGLSLAPSAAQTAAGKKKAADGGFEP